VTRTGRIARGLSILGLTAALILASATANRAHESVPVQIEALTQEIQHHPGNPLLRLQRADLHREQREWDAARADFEAALAIDPDLEIAWLGLGRMYLEAGRPGEAIAPLERFLTYNPSSAVGTALLGRALTRSGRHDEAVIAFSESIAIGKARGFRPGPDLFLDRARSQMVGGDVDAALSGLEEGRSLLGGAASLEVEALAIEIDAGLTGRALARLERLTAESPRPERWLVQRGALLERTGREDLAADAYRAARETIVNLPPSRRRASHVIGMEREIDAALSRLERVARDEP